MDKSLMIFIAIGLGFLYFVTNFIGGIQEEDDNYRNDGYNQAHQYDQYQDLDSIGREVLNVIGAPAATQISAWNNSMLKTDFMMLFPDFSAMNTFVEERVSGDILKNKLLKNIMGVEDLYFSGNMTQEQAKTKLGSLK